jgi:protein-disulfide isomerase
LDQRIVAVAPLSMIPPGVYLLTVTCGTQRADVTSIEVRIGSGLNSSRPESVGALPDAASTPKITAGYIPDPKDPAARVGDHVFTIADVDREWQRTDPVGYLASSRELYEARQRVVSSMVTNELLSKEAASRGMTVDALLREELPKRTIPMPDTAVSALYQSLGDRARGASLEQLQPAIREWLARKVEPDVAKMAYVEELTKLSMRADNLLVPPRVEVEHLADDPVIGPADSSIEIVLFADFESPVYGRDAMAIPRVRDTFGNRVRFVFKYFPANDPASIAAAEAAACANRQGKFWPFHDRLLSEAGALDGARFKKVAADIGVDQRVFDACVDREETRDRIGAALDETQRYGLPGSPSILVNGQLAPEPPAFLPPFEFFKRVIEEELQRQARQAH